MFICVIKALLYEMLVIHVFCQSGFLKVHKVPITIPWVPFASVICSFSCQHDLHELFLSLWLHQPTRSVSLAMAKNQLSKVLTNLAFFFMLSMNLCQLWSLFLNCLGLFYCFLDSWYMLLAMKFSSRKILVISHRFEPFQRVFIYVIF